MAKPSLREKIVESGMKTVHERGFSNSGVRDITSDAGVPLGSFSNHFRSKEDFGVAVVNHYHLRTQETMDTTLRDATRPPMARLNAYFDAVTERLRAAGWRFGCLVGNMSLEAPEHSEAIRLYLADVCAELTESFAGTIRDGQQADEIRRDVDAADLAAFLFSAWEGAMLRMKVDRSPKPISQFRHVIIDTLLRPAPSEVTKAQAGKGRTK